MLLVRQPAPAFLSVAQAGHDGRDAGPGLLERQAGVGQGVPHPLHLVLGRHGLVIGRHGIEGLLHLDARGIFLFPRFLEQLVIGVELLFQLLFLGAQFGVAHPHLVQGRQQLFLVRGLLDLGPDLFLRGLGQFGHMRPQLAQIPVADTQMFLHLEQVVPKHGEIGEILLHLAAAHAQGIAVVVPGLDGHERAVRVPDYCPLIAFGGFDLGDARQHGNAAHRLNEL